jgi:Acetyltransferase (GNAT) family
MSGHNGRRGYLQHLVVLPAHRNQGIASGLVESCLAEFERLGILKSHIDVLKRTRSPNATGKGGGGSSEWTSVGTPSYVLVAKTSEGGERAINYQWLEPGVKNGMLDHKSSDEGWDSLKVVIYAFKNLNAVLRLSEFESNLAPDGCSCCCISLSLRTDFRTPHQRMRKLLHHPRTPAPPAATPRARSASRRSSGPGSGRRADRARVHRGQAG